MTDRGHEHPINTLIFQCVRVVLYGLYHENREWFCDDFHTRSKAAAEEEIRAGIEILQEIGIKMTFTRKFQLLHILSFHPICNGTVHSNG
jgi:hypothetical protein